MKCTAKGTKPTDAFSQRQMDNYLSRLSKPLIDRVDIHVEVPAVPHHHLTGKGPRGTDTATMRKQVLAARQLQLPRNGGPLKPNASLSGRELDTLAPLDDMSRELLKQAMTEMGLSARAYDKLRRVSRTIADLDNSAAIQQQHVAEAVQYRLLDRQM